MTSSEISLVYAILERRFGQSEAEIGKIMLEYGEMTCKDIYRQAKLANPSVPSKSVERILNLFFQNSFLIFKKYPEFSDDDFLSLDINRVYFLLMEPLMCYAVEDIFGDEASQVLSVVFALAAGTAEEIVKVLESTKQLTKANTEKAILQLIRARVLTAWDSQLKIDDEDCRIDWDAVAKKQSWTKYVIKINPPRLFTVYLLYLTQARVENDPALGATGCETFLGLCRACLFGTPNPNFICDDRFQAVSATEVFSNLPETAKDGLTVSTLTQNLNGLVNHIDGFLIKSDHTFVMKGTKLLGIWAEQFLYDILKAEMPQIPMARAVMQYLIRSAKPYIQATALETDLIGSVHSLRYAINELCRLGFADLMGTSHVAAFEPVRTQHFLFVNLPRLYRQKILPEFCKNIQRVDAAMKKNLPHRSAFDNTSTINKFRKMEIGFLDGFIFSVMYIQAAGEIFSEDSSREACTLVEFFNRKPIPDGQ